MDRGARRAAVHGVAKGRSTRNDVPLVLSDPGLPSLLSIQSQPHLVPGKAQGETLAQ